MSTHLDQLDRAEPKGPVTVTHDIEKTGVEGHNDSRPDSLKAEAEEDTQHFQRGVRQARAITAVWSKNTLWMMFALFYLVSFVDMLLVSVQSSLNPYITSEFGRHGLLAAVNVVPTILSGTGQLTLAKIIDLWGRIEGFMVMLLITILGNIVKATAQSIQTYVAAQTLYWVGHIGLLFTIDVMLADMTTLRNRMLVFTINSTPTIATTFAGPRVAELFYNNLNFRWAFGAFSFIAVGICAPVIVVMLWSQRRAVKTGALVRVPSDRTWWQEIVHVYIQMDVTGIILITAAFAMFLLPFSLSTYAPNGWSEGYIIALIVLGVLFFPVFYAWERWLTPVPFLDWKYLQDMTILGSCFLYGLMFVSIFTWNAYFGSYLQVVHQLSISNAGYVLNALSLTSSIFSPLFALIIRWTGNFKYTAYAGVPLLLLGTALLIPFRSPGTNVGLVAFTQILVGLGSGIFATCTPLAIMSPVTHQEIATVLAVQSLFGSIGASIGIAIAGAMWNNIMPGQLLARLPEEITPEMGMMIFGDITLQLGYEWGSPEREAIVDAYGNVQRKMAIAGACFVPLCLASIYFWRNINVKKLEEREGKQTRGTVF